MIFSLRETAVQSLAQRLSRTFKSMVVYDFGGYPELMDMLLHLYPHLKIGKKENTKENLSSGILLSAPGQDVDVLIGDVESYSLDDSTQQRYHISPAQLEGEAKSNRDLFSEMNFRFKVENQLVVLEEKHINKVLFHLNDTLINRQTKFGSILSCLVLARMVGADVFEYNERLTGYLLRQETHIFKDLFTKIEFADYSQIHTNEDMLRVLRYTNNDSIIVLGGKITQLSSMICEKIVQKKCQLILLDLFGPIQLGNYENEISPIRVANVKDAVDTVYVIAENPSRVCLFPCMYMAETISGVMSRKFELEVSLC